MTREADEEDYRRDRIDAREAERASRCRCSRDMPGHCPGPQFCPLCADEAEEPEEQLDEA